jgi:hypothetical protein
VAAALLLAATVDPANIAGWQKQFLAVGLKVAGGEIKKGEPG